MCDAEDELDDLEREYDKLEKQLEKLKAADRAVLLERNLEKERVMEQLESRLGKHDALYIEIRRLFYVPINASVAAQSALEFCA